MEIFQRKEEKTAQVSECITGEYRKECTKKSVSQGEYHKESIANSVSQRVLHKGSITRRVSQGEYRKETRIELHKEGTLHKKSRSLKCITGRRKPELEKRTIRKKKQEQQQVSNFKLQNDKEHVSSSISSSGSSVGLVCESGMRELY